MKELKCPNCGNFFTVDEADYASIVSQVRNAEFEAEMERRIADLHKQHQTEQQVIEANALNKYQQELNKKAEEQIRMRQTSYTQAKLSIPTGWDTAKNP